LLTDWYCVGGIVNVLLFSAYSYNKLTLTVFGCSVVYADSGRSKIFLGCYPLKFGISKLIERFLPFDDYIKIKISCPRKLLSSLVCQDLTFQVIESFHRCLCSSKPVAT